MFIFFGNDLASKWDFKNFKSAFESKDESKLRATYCDCLVTIKSDSRAIPSGVTDHINTLLNVNEQEASETIVNIIYVFAVLHS